MPLTFYSPVHHYGDLHQSRAYVCKVRASFSSEEEKQERPGGAVSLATATAGQKLEEHSTESRRSSIRSKDGRELPPPPRGI